MNKKSINKINLFFMGIESRFNENKNIFKNIFITFKTGLKEFKGIGKYQDDKINFNFNGTSKLYNINELLTYISEQCNIYDCIELIYSERGANIIIYGDNKNVTIKSKEDSLDKDSKNSNINHNETTSSLLNRDYYVKVGKADPLLKEINIMTKDGKIKNDKIRKYNQIDHYVELLDSILSKLPKNETINILDCGCGKSYLSFVLNYYLTEVKKYKCNFIGLDYSEKVIKASKKMANNLGYRNMDFYATDIKDYIPDKHINIVMSLHACDTATDMALALGIKLNSDIIIAVPCCHRELLNQYSYEPFNSILKYGILKERLASIITEGMRGTMLEAYGYDVSIVEYISPLETPKNLMIRAIKEKKENKKSIEQYENLMKVLNVKPALYRFLEEW